MNQLSSPLLLLLALLFPSTIAVDTLTPTTPIKDGQSLVSSGGSFRLGFFSPENSKNRFLGIWYNKISKQTAVWVANRANPLNDSTGVLAISSNGSLVLQDGSLNVLWSSASSANTSNPVAQLLDNGNFVLRASDSSGSENYAWESFNYPSDTLLSGMKLGWDLKTGINRYLTAWKAQDDPSPGDYSFRMDIRELPELYMFKGSERVYASGPWNGLEFSGVPELQSSDILSFSFISNKTDAYYSFVIDNSNIISRFVMSESGQVQRYVWLNSSQAWSLFWQDPKDQCDYYEECGPFGVCDSNNSTICSCLRGFVPKSSQNWNLRDWSDGCVRVNQLDCKGDGFLTMQNMKLPDTTNATLNTSMTLDECEKSCLLNCSCMAYASANISGGGSGCITWPSELIDLRQFQSGGQDLFVRLPASDLPDLNTGNSSKKKPILAIVLSIVFGLLFFGLVGYYTWKKKVKGHINMACLPSQSDLGSAVLLARNQAVLGNLAKDYCLDDETSDGKDLELPLFDIYTIMAATNNFEMANKLGEGGFGPVYKGKLGDGQEIAVKRLSKNSLQGLDEFKNEVKLIAKLQHRNLVRLLGFCTHVDERMLVYEYMHNRSLDTYIFNEANRTVLNWQTRFNIILGISRGLLYLHQDSRLLVIHRDLKASNILLDSEMNPKISDFGLARIFGGNQNDAYTHRVVGTYGYMSPEYAMDGIFSMKSDVFSFGVLILEIVSGKKNRGFYSAESHLNLLSYAWRLWKEGKGLELLDKSLGSSYSASEVLRCIQVSLLCVQEQANERPMMSAVSMMLGSDSATLPEPNEPGFSTSRAPVDTDSSSAPSVNGVTLTMIQSR